MTQEEKELLLKDISARLPYGVKVWFPDWLSGYTSAIESIDIDGYIKDFEGATWEVSDCKPYLFPLSSMTKEQKLELTTIKTYVSLNKNKEYLLFDWLNENHFDYRGLLEKGLAIDATDKNIY